MSAKDQEPTTDQNVESACNIDRVEGESFVFITDKDFKDLPNDTDDPQRDASLKEIGDTIEKPT